MANRCSIVNLSEDVLFAEKLFNAGTPMVIFDLETTGLSSNTDKILSISGIKVINKGGIPEIINKLDLLINPGFPIPGAVTQINGISDEMVKDKPTEEKAFEKIEAFFGSDPFLCGYNSKRFDEKFLTQLYARQGKTFSPLFHLDVMQMAKEQLDMPSYKLTDIAHELGVDKNLTFHRSIDDVIATFRCFYILKKEYELTKTDDGPKANFKIKKINYWLGPNHTLERIYIQTLPYSNTFYDIYKKEWRSDNDLIDLKHIRNHVLEIKKVKDEAELVKQIKTTNNR